MIKMDKNVFVRLKNLKLSKAHLIALIKYSFKINLVHKSNLEREMIETAYAHDNALENFPLEEALSYLHLYRASCSSLFPSVLRCGLN